MGTRRGSSKKSASVIIQTRCCMFAVEYILRLCVCVSWKVVCVLEVNKREMNGELASISISS